MKTRVLVGGAILGALTGLSAAYLLVRTSEQEGTEIQVSPSEGIRIGLTLLALLRQVATIGDGE
ncbi:MAG TPA: hypothetical protein VJ768_11820 [Anaerolineales bacterium]|nr:hypothetical protein [Anaerolineales bacterium]